MRRLDFFLLVLFVLFWASPTQTFAISHIVISSQVRGSECCDPGNDNTFLFQKAWLEKYKLPGTFALRFDALGDKTITQALKESSFEVASFLEVTPSLASASGVVYRGPVDRWYKASNAYLVGYNVGDRQKLIDTYMRKFYEVFGAYPHSNVSWMVDAYSLSYLKEKYDIQVQEITREQWGTDSYSLYGGPVNVPYYPSKSWPLIPASTQAAALPVLVMRQTLTDALYTYGDEQSSYTSQPNDYLFGQKDFSYFTGLLDNALRSSFPNGFAVVGLETSMEQKFQDEYAKQLGYIASLRDQKAAKPMSMMQLLNEYPESSTVGQMSAYVSPSEDTDKHAYWITTPHYRARLIADRDQVLLSDLRVYSDNLQDPYMSTASSTLNAYWTVPFLLDGSRYLTTKPTSFLQQTKNFVSSVTTQKRGGTDYNRTQNDLMGNATGLEFPPIKIDSSLQFTYTPLTSIVSYPSRRGTVTIQFLSDRFEVQLPDKDTATNTMNSPDIAKLAADGDVRLDQKVKGTTTEYTPVISSQTTMDRLISSYPALYAPESLGGSVDYDQSDFIVANKRAIVNRNPIRLVIRLVDSTSTPTVTSEKPQVMLSNPTIQVTQFEPESAHGEYYIDLASTVATQTDVAVLFGSKKISFGTVYFVPNCTKELVSCVKHPTYFYQFVLSKLDEISRKLRGA